MMIFNQNEINFKKDIAKSKNDDKIKIRETPIFIKKRDSEPKKHEITSRKG